MVDTDGRRSGIEKRQFSYSDHLTEKRVGIDLSILPEKKPVKNPTPNRGFVGVGKK
jgi:hypothetical protein